MKKLIILFLLIPFLGFSQAKFGGNSIAAARASLKNSNTYTLTYVDDVLQLVSTTTNYPISFGASGTYLPINNPTATGTLTAPTIANTLGATFATSSGNVGIGNASPTEKLDVTGNIKISGTSSLLGDVGVGGSVITGRTLSVLTTTNDVNFQSINSRTTGANYAISGNANGVGASLNMGGFYAASGGSSNMGLRIYNVAAGTNNYSLYSDSPAQSYFQGNVGIGTTSPAVILDINSTGAIKIPVGTDAQRPSSPATGMLRVNTTASPAKLEYYNGSSWIQL